MFTFIADPWTPNKWRLKQNDQLEKRLQALDLALKILVPAALLICLIDRKSVV